ncbi:MAG: sulfate transporter [Gammaproteobacteria bacterium]|nr:MAG: sulfate transporter [Gammaproteobacteria bacterium]
MNRILTIFFLLLITMNVVLAEDESFITLSSTTSTDNSGLLEYLIPKFKNKTGIDVRVIAVGTGRALLLGERGDADIVLVHHQISEEEFVESGFGIDRRDVMYNDYVIVGPKNDPADINELKHAADAFKLISQHQVPFVSRGDNSGTHKKEIELWSLANVDAVKHSGDWYREAGAGMGATLNIANGMSAYTMTDRGTWLSFKNRDDLTLLFENDPPLFNQYGVILVNPDRHGHIKYLHAKQFSDWLISNEGQQAIADYTLEDQQLFFPNARHEIATVETD